jgi:tetratricopeptide (TPR) repeat protein
MESTPTALFAGLGIAVAVLTSASARGQEKDHVSWWVRQYGLVDAIQQPRAIRAERIFERLAATADKRANRVPRLAVLDADGNPFAMALPDGTILLTRGALRICYQNVPLATGDARLAFVLGHELSHLSNDDFWHAAAFDAMTLHGETTPSDEVVTILFEDSPEDAVKRELQADAYGMLYMTTAGYDPQVLFQKGSFFEEWAQELDALGVRALNGHPGPAERGTFLRSQLAALADELNFFHFGTRFIQLGRLKDGLLLLERFRDRFPSREVLNNVGVGHYQLAGHVLGDCDGRLLLRFKLPSVLDPTTRASRIMSGSGTSPCFRSERFRFHVREAETNLIQAAEMDPAYAAARLNLLSLHVLAHQGAQALVAAEEVKKLLPDDPAVQSGAAVALYLYGEQSRLELADTAIEQLERIHREHPESSVAAYNLAGILAERRRAHGATSAYRTFLALEPFGIHADAARDYLGEKPRPGNESADALNALKPTVPLGPVSLEELHRRTQGLRVQEFTIGDFRGTFFNFERGRAIAIKNTTEMVDEQTQDGENSGRAIDLFGEPKYRFTLVTGHLLVYERVALEIVDDKVVRRVFF